MSKKVDEHQSMLIISTVEGLVLKTKAPVATSVLVKTGLATRAELRKLEKSGLLKRCLVSAGRGIMNAYYTEGAVPDAIRRKQAERAEQRRPSEIKIEGETKLVEYEKGGIRFENYGDSEESFIKLFHAGRLVGKNEIPKTTIQGD